MMWKVKSSKVADKSLESIPGNIRKNILLKLKELSKLDNPLSHNNVISLTGDYVPLKRLRVGNYRVMFEIDEEKKIIQLHDVLIRSKAYKK